MSAKNYINLLSAPF